MGAKSKSKKKGPKGKKARAKAKLEQVWGENVDEDARKASRLRVGKSRLSAEGGKNDGSTKKDVVDPFSNKQRRNVKSTFDKFLERKKEAAAGGGFNNGHYPKLKQRFQRNNNQRRHGHAASSDDSSDDGDDDSDDDEVKGAASFATLLKRISGPTTKEKSSSSRMAVDSEDDSSSEDDGMESDSDASEELDSDADMENHSEEEDKSDDDSLVSENEEEQNGGEIVTTSTSKKAAAAIVVEDPYDAHFSKPTLPSSQLDSSLQSSSITTPITTTGRNNKSKSVSTTALLNNSSSSMDVQMSGPILDSWEEFMKRSASETTAVPTSGKKKKKQKINTVTQTTKKAWEEFATGPYYQHVRQVLERNWKSVNNQSALKRSGGTEKVFSSLQLAMYPAISRYADVLISSETRQNRDDINNLLSMHILNHVLTSRTRVQRHNRRIKELTNAADNENAADDGGDDDKGRQGKKQLDNNDEEDADKWRDQGYTRPKVLVLLPTRGSCWKFVQQMIKMLGDAAIVYNGEKFDEEYGPLEGAAAAGEEDNSDDDEEEEDDNAKARRAAVLKQKGAEWNDLFGDDANNDDDFKMGLSITPNAVVKSLGKKKSKQKKNATVAGGGASGVNVKLFAEFYRSDIILASPIGLKMATTGEEDGDDDDDDDEAQANVDFLSSIDICLVARSDVLLMQNWDHVNTILDSLNQQPKKITDIDFSRVRNYFLEGQASQWRQTIVVSQFTDPYILSTFRRHANNVEGQLKIRRKVDADDASICNVMVHRIRQVFQRVACQSISEAGTNRLRYFSDHVLPKLLRMKQKHTLIYIQSYFDFIAVRNLLLKREADFVSVTEYARVSEVSRGRARFLQGRKSIMLYTGRAHFFLRHKIKGARHVIFFGLPEYADFYPSIVNMLNEGLLSNDIGEDDDASRMPMSCLSLFTKFDAHQLERVVGTSHTERMIKGEKSSFMFCS